MHLYDAFTYRAIAARLGVPEEHVLKVLKTAYAKVRCRTADVENNTLSDAAKEEPVE